MISYVASVFFLCCSLMGWSVLCRRISRLAPALCPVVALSFLDLAVFLSGLVDCLSQSSWLLHGVGIALLLAAAAVPSWRQRAAAFLRNPGILFFLALFWLLAFACKDLTYVYYDEFSHWGSIVKDMFATGCFPADGSIVSRVGSFVNYPPASASFIYFVDVLVGYTEGHTIFAQNILVVAALCALWAPFEGRLCGKREAARNILCTLLALSAMLFMTPVIRITSVLVDALLGLLFVSSVLILLSREGGLPRLLLCGSLPVLVCSFVKDNGKIFLALFLLLGTYLLVRGLRNCRNGRRDVIGPICAMLVPVALFLVFSVFWNAHVDGAFAAGYESGKFSVTADRFQGAPMDDLSVVALRVLVDAFASDATRVVVFWGLNAACFGTIVLCRVRRSPALFLERCAAVANATVLATVLALVVLYTYFMPPSETVGSLGGFDRYYGTALLVFACLSTRGLIWCCLRETSERPSGHEVRVGVHLVEDRLHRIAPVLIGVVLCCSLVPNAISLIVDSPYGSRGPEGYSEGRRPVSSVLGEGCTIPPNSTVACFVDAPSGLAYFVALYETEGAVVQLTSQDEPAAATGALERCQYLAFLGEDWDAFEAFIGECGASFTEPPNPDRRCFRISVEDGGMRLAPV